MTDDSNTRSTAEATINSEEAPIPEGVRYEIRRAAAYVAVFDVWREFGISGSLIEEWIEPHQQTLSWAYNRHHVSPVVPRNPVDIVGDEIEGMGLLNPEAVAEAIELTQDFYDVRADIFPMSLDIEKVEDSHKQ